MPKMLNALEATVRRNLAAPVPERMLPRYPDAAALRRKRALGARLARWWFAPVSRGGGGGTGHVRVAHWMSGTGAGRP